LFCHFHSFGKTKKARSASNAIWANLLPQKSLGAGQAPLQKGGRPGYPCHLSTRSASFGSGKSGNRQLTPEGFGAGFCHFPELIVLWAGVVVKEKS
jgi:hypothetical protein